LWSLRISEQAAVLDSERGLLDAQERARAAAFVRAADRDRYRLAHIGLRQLLGAYLDTDPAAVPLCREPCPGCGGPHGRPAVPGAPLHFSLSHSGDLVLLAFAGSAIGVDVEALPSAEIAAEVGRTLHPAECAELDALAASERPAGFARCWTRKEAYLKGVGTGLAGGLSLTYVGTGQHPAPLAEWWLADVPVDEGYAAACAVRRFTRTAQQTRR
jgi:4'-phosphopantetheinyl transferase